MGTGGFHELTIDMVIDCVEQALGARCTNLCRSLNSYINRVYELETEDRDPVIAKFYRPGRWSRAALQDEHDFLLELATEEIPVIAPLAQADGETLHEHGGMYFALFPKKGGRIVDEPSMDQWKELGRLVARMHLVGSRRDPEDRVTLSPEEITREQLDSLLDSGLISPGSERAFADVANEVVDRIEPMFEKAELIRIHGDLHCQNLIFRPDEGFYLIDFDDMVLGPPTQDLWMLLPGRVVDARRETDAFIDGYEMFREFDYAGLKLVEALRAMRFIHYCAWCARQAADGGYVKLDPDWGDDRYWKQEIFELRRQLQEIEDAR